MLYVVVCVGCVVVVVCCRVCARLLVGAVFVVVACCRLNVACWCMLMLAVNCWRG